MGAYYHFVITDPRDPSYGPYALRVGVSSTTVIKEWGFVKLTVVGDQYQAVPDATNASGTSGAMRGGGWALFMGTKAFGDPPVFGTLNCGTFADIPEGFDTQFIDRNGVLRKATYMGHQAVPTLGSAVRMAVA